MRPAPPSGGGAAEAADLFAADRLVGVVSALAATITYLRRADALVVATAEGLIGAAIVLVESIATVLNTVAHERNIHAGRSAIQGVVIAAERLVEVTGTLGHTVADLAQLEATAATLKLVSGAAATGFVFAVTAVIGSITDDR